MPKQANNEDGNKSYTLAIYLNKVLLGKNDYHSPFINTVVSLDRWDMIRGFIRGGIKVGFRLTGDEETMLLHSEWKKPEPAVEAE